MRTFGFQISLLCGTSPISIFVAHYDSMVIAVWMSICLSKTLDVAVVGLQEERVTKPLRHNMTHIWISVMGLSNVLLTHFNLSQIQ